MSLRRLSTVDTRLSETCKQAANFLSLHVRESGAWQLYSVKIYKVITAGVRLG